MRCVSILHESTRSILSRDAGIQAAECETVYSEVLARESYRKDALHFRARVDMERYRRLNLSGYLSASLFIGLRKLYG